MKKFLFITLFYLASLVSKTSIADVQFKFSGGAIEQCLSTSQDIDRLKCVGKSSDICMQENEGGNTTVGMSYCFSLEGELWDKKLNTAYKELLNNERADDANNKEQGGFAPEKVPSLKDMQRAWINYRDALCTHEAVQWGGGTGQGPAFAACIAGETARQYFVLHDRLSYGR